MRMVTDSRRHGSLRRKGSPGARAVPYGVTGTNGVGFQLLSTPMFTLRSHDTHLLPCKTQTSLFFMKKSRGKVIAFECKCAIIESS